MHNMKMLEDKLTEKLKQYLDGDVIYDAMREVPALMSLDTDTMLKLRDALLAQVAEGGIQVTVKLPSSKALAKQRREARVK